ncbi:MAG TPA: PEGA domain-containing protein [Myxococcales bacterium]
MLRTALAAAALALLAACSEPKPQMDKVLPPEVAIQTIPASCTVTIDGADRGITPLVLKAEGPEGTRKLVFRKDGFLPAELSLSTEEIKAHTGEAILFYMRPGNWDPKAKNIDPNNAIQLTKAGQDLSKAGRCQEALPYLNRALEIDGRLAPPHKALGTCYAKMKNNAKALEHYKWYLLAAPDAPDAPKLRAIVDRASGDIDMGDGREEE